GPLYCETPKSLRPWLAPAGKSFEPSLPTPAAKACTVAGILNTIQCRQPPPARASGSQIVTAKLCVPGGSPDQVSAGEMFCPLAGAESLEILRHTDNEAGLDESHRVRGFL